ncbi:Zn-dependent M28 family amino/carboxypeptidase [Sphingomonas kaistensis]|uniref:Zn-dependent M28 family amino/carboxypeptidase n=1 Tax=Sphingomonas kaistensis TaxID=298708 RepID=A0A7X5Y819_9SPHN|nr:M20/M25/M40 family metallo-hydrolase [Sphingomonas kaistensis]NJC06859.1 Zn-dependent M28 family amino/carboxypeptidase [Sphingomonas kaistensis]
MLRIVRVGAVMTGLTLLGGCQSVEPASSIAIAPPQPAAASAEADKAPGISMERMSEITRVLASDAFEGRSMGTPGEARTTAYLIEQFKAAGLEPGGQDGGWTQAVPMIRTKLQSPQLALQQGSTRTPLSFPGDIYLSTVRDTQAAEIAGAPIVFVGYGTSAPERGWDDFKGVDLKGKVALFLVNDPDFEAASGEPVAGKFGGKTMTYYGRWTYKFEEAARRGAIGAIIVHETEGAGYGWNVVQSAGGENFNIVLPRGATQPVLLQGWMQQAAAEAMLKRAGYDYATLKRQARSTAFRPIDLKARFVAKAGVELERIQSQNVIGKLTGSRFPDETVSYSGHWDAYGLGAPDTQGRTVRPGAADDALGLAAMIEIARRFAGGKRPERSLVFAAWTAEERGLLGSEYYAQNPLYPHEKMVANLTLDTLQWAGPTRDTVLIGQGQSEMERYLEEGARAQGRTVTPESKPERGLFYRADHFTLAKRGVPVLLSMALAGAYDLQEGGRPAGERWLEEFTGKCYHQTCDAWAPTWDLRGALQEADLYYAIGERLANGRDWPRWNRGSEFWKVREDSAGMRGQTPVPQGAGERG